MNIIGHKKNRLFLEGLIKSGKFSHAYLFCGQEHLGKRTSAIEFLKEFFGKDIFSHPDFNIVEPLENEIQISQIRNLNWKLSLKPFSAPFKAVVIDKAHLMNQEAQNCFLKTLEEPRGKTLVILISEYPEMLLPTIKSRVEKIKFYPVEEKEIESFLIKKGKSKDETKIFSEISMGRPGVAIDFLNDPEKFLDFKKKINEIMDVLNFSLEEKFQYAKNLSEQENLKETLNIWLIFFRNIFLSNFNLQKNWISLRRKYDFEKLRITLKNIQSTIFLVTTTNTNQKLALELLLMEM
jgi:DNA polymerase-3 subunit delta'